MTKARRYVARQIIHSLTVLSEVVYHELWRVVNTEADALKRSEWRQATRTLSKLREVNNELSQLGNAIQTGEPPS